MVKVVHSGLKQFLTGTWYLVHGTSTGILVSILCLADLTVTGAYTGENLRQCHVPVPGPVRECGVPGMLLSCGWWVSDVSFAHDHICGHYCLAEW